MTEQEANIVANLKLVDLPYLNGSVKAAKNMLKRRYGEQLSEDTLSDIANQITEFQKTLSYDKTFEYFDTFPVNRVSYMRDEEGFVYKRIGNQLYRASSLKGTYTKISIESEGMDLLLRSFRHLLPEEEAIVNE